MNSLLMLAVDPTVFILILILSKFLREFCVSNNIGNNVEYRAFFEMKWANVIAVGPHSDFSDRSPRINHPGGFFCCILLYFFRLTHRGSAGIHGHPPTDQPSPCGPDVF